MSGWGKRFETIVNSWEGGVRTSARHDLIPENTSPLVYNGSWERIGDETAVIAKRPGYTLINSGTSLASAIHGQYFYDQRSLAGTYTTHHLLFLQDGAIKTINDTDGTITPHSSGSFSGTITGKYVSGITASNRTFIVAETPTTASGATGHGLKFDGTTWSVMGINSGAAPTVSGAVAGVMTGTFDVAISYYNSATGHQSSRSPETSITVTSKQLAVSWVPSTDLQVTHVNVHLRNQTISTGFYEAISVPVGTASTNLNLSTSDYNALTTISPDEDENEMVPEGSRFLTWHKSRIFAATSSYVYYSKVEFPEAFDIENYEPVNTDDGQQIMGMVPFLDNLIIFKERSFYSLVGDGPNDWEIQQISTKVGLTASGSIISVEGLLYWWSNDGPVVWDGINEPQRLGKTLIAQTLQSAIINTTRFNQIQGIEDRQNERILWSLPEAGEEENTIILPYKYRLGQFEGIWTGIHVASWARGEFTDGFEWCYMGSYGGRVYRFGDSDLDGLPSGAVYTGTFTPATTSVSTITGIGFDITTGYADLHVVIIESLTGKLIDKVEIVSNTSTVLTLADALNGLITTTTYRYYIAGVDFRFDTRWQDDKASTYKKRYEFLFLQTEADKESTLYVGLSFNYNNEPEIERTLSISSASDDLSSPLWDESLWDVAYWTSVVPVDNKLRIARASKTWRVTLVHTEPNVDFALYKIGVSGEYLTTKR